MHKKRYGSWKWKKGFGGGYRGVGEGNWVEID